MTETELAACYEAHKKEAENWGGVPAPPWANVSRDRVGRRLILDFSAYEARRLYDASEASGLAIVKFGTRAVLECCGAQQRKPVGVGAEPE